MKKNRITAEYLVRTRELRARIFQELNESVLKTLPTIEDIVADTPVDNEA